MGLSIAEKIIKTHLVSGEMTPGSDIGLRIDQTLTQDATGTMAYLEFEAMGVPRVKTERSVAYIDHNTLQNGFENADDHRFIRTVAKKARNIFFASGQRNMPSGSSRAFFGSGQDPYRIGQPHPHLRRYRHARHGFGRNGCCGCNGRRRISYKYARNSKD